MANIDYMEVLNLFLQPFSLDVYAMTENDTDRQSLNHFTTESLCNTKDNHKRCLNLYIIMNTKFII